MLNSSSQAPDVRGNPGLLRQVFLNIIVNAVEAMSPKGGTLRILGRRAGNQAEIRISDTGPGVPPEIRARILDPFFSTKGPRGGWASA